MLSRLDHEYHPAASRAIRSYTHQSSNVSTGEMASSTSDINLEGFTQTTLTTHLSSRPQPSIAGSALQRQAIQEAQTACSLLPKGHVIFQQCVKEQETLVEVVSAVTQKCHSFKKNRFAKLLGTFQKYTIWLQNISSVVDVIVQTQAGIGCPLWAPIKFILKVGLYGLNSP